MIIHNNTLMNKSNVLISCISQVIGLIVKVLLTEFIWLLANNILNRSFSHIKVIANL